MSGAVDERFVGLYTFFATVKHNKELSKERCDELEGLVDELFIKVMEVKK
jgi:hypothetical protein